MFIRIFYLVLFVPLILKAQDITGYSIHQDNDIFLRENMKSLSTNSFRGNIPSIDCSLEYLRRAEDSEIVYRRGPISLHQKGFGSLEGLQGKSEGSQPGSESYEPGRSSFVGGMLVDLPRAGESSDASPPMESKFKYMLRVSVVPSSYRNEMLQAKILLERAVVEVHGEDITVLQSEVFLRDVEIHGNDPLNFSLPKWEIVQDTKIGSVPAALQESLLITLETPRNFGFSRNYPEPFSEFTNISYAVPRQARVMLTVKVKGQSIILDDGEKEAGIYHVAWNAEDLPDGSYTATLSAQDAHGTQLHEGTLQLKKDMNAQSYSPPHYTAFRPSGDRIVFGTESGFAYQFPRDAKKSLRNMFTHIAIKIGYRISQTWETGILAGQDSFHETPQPNVDIARISSYGGVVAYTYGYFGVYSRWAFTSGIVQPFFESSLSFTNEAPVVELGLGLRALLFSKIELYAMPMIMSHFRSDVSSKFGLNYGISITF